MDLNIFVTKKLIENAQIFAAKRLGLSADLYAKRGEQSISKIEQDIITGAIAEGAVFNLFRRNKIKSTKPDFKVYEKRKKSYKADLVSRGYNIHVKSQTYESANKYGASWLFQKEDPLFKNPSDTELLVFCLVDKDFVSVEAIISTKELVENDLIKDPIVFRYQFTKKAIYLNDIIRNTEIGAEDWIQKLIKNSQKK